MPTILDELAEPDSNPSYPEDQTRNPNRWGDFRGWQAETRASKAPPDYLPLWKQLQAPSPRDLQSFKKGGKVKKTGVYKLHKGEKVLSAKQTRQEARDKALLQKTRYRRKG